MNDKTTKDSNTENALMDFNGLILGFSSAALYYLGETKIDGKSFSEVNLSLAKQNIEIIEMLKLKTAGNLSEDEDKLLTQVLHDLCTKFDSAANK